MRKLLIWIVGTLALLAGALVLAATLLDTALRPVPPVVAGYHVAQVQASHRVAPLELHMWYPTQETAEPILIGQNALFYGAYAYPDARPVAGPLPLVVMSHGSGGNAPRLAWLAADLANRGMVVVATNHPGTTSGDSDPFQTIKVWERPQDMAALIDFLQTERPAGVTIDPARIGALGFSLGGHSALSLAGLKVSKARFIDYCDANAGLIDCGWMQAAGVDFATIDAALYEQSNKDIRVSVAVAVDPALPQAVADGGLSDLDVAPLIINLGAPETVPAAMRADGVAALISGARFETILGAQHFSFLAECSGLGRVIIGLAGDDNICSDAGMRDRGIIHAELQQMIGGFLADRLGAVPARQ